MMNILTTLPRFFAGLMALLILLSACESIGGNSISYSGQEEPQSPDQLLASTPEYLIGPLDQLQVFVWRAPELSTDVVVRPDGRISTPLVEDMLAAGKTPSALARDLEVVLADFVRTPEVTVIVSQFSSTFDQQVRVLGEAQRPVALPYQAGMTVLDVMVAVGGLTEFAAGNKAVLIRGRGSNRSSYRLKLDDLMRKADVRANVPVAPGDVILIPESIF
ncbi:MAG: polysaccharide export protein [Aquisalinus sp.]|nr:polysaccharide export protein [Aquisalinus sp.]